MTIAIPATTNAASGAISAGRTTSVITACHLTAALPRAAIVAPTIPPISAWDELDGRPYDHVIRFHAIAATSAAKTIVSLTRAASTMPVAMVAATFSEMNA